MFKKLKILAATFALSLVVLLPAPSVYAAPLGPFDFFKDSCKQAPDSAVCKQNAQQRLENENPALNVIRTAANLIAVATGIAAIGLIILGSLNLITSGGNADTVAKGRRRIIYSLVGLVIVALAYTITRFITDRVLQ